MFCRVQEEEKKLGLSSMERLRKIALHMYVARVDWLIRRRHDMRLRVRLPGRGGGEFFCADLKSKACLASASVEKGECTWRREINSPRGEQVCSGYCVND